MKSKKSGKKSNQKGKIRKPHPRDYRVVKSWTVTNDPKFRPIGLLGQDLAWAYKWGAILGTIAAVSMVALVVLTSSGCALLRNKSTYNPSMVPERFIENCLDLCSSKPYLDITVETGDTMLFRCGCQKDACEEPKPTIPTLGI